VLAIPKQPPRHPQGPLPRSLPPIRDLSPQGWWWA
jgi:hypothetical protein